MKKDTNFFGEVIHEMKETTWPTAAEMRKYSNRVFMTVLLFGVFFWLGDTAIAWLLSLI